MESQLSVRWRFKQVAMLVLLQPCNSVQVCMHARTLTKTAMQPRHYAAPPRQRRQSMESARMVRLLRKVSMYGGVDPMGAPLQVGWRAALHVLSSERKCRHTCQTYMLAVTCT